MASSLTSSSPPALDPLDSGLGSGHGGGAAATRRPKKLKLCRYFGSGSGCRVGDSCLFLHDPLMLPGGDKAAERQGGSSSSASAAPSLPRNDQVSDRRQAVSKPISSHVVPKPVPSSQIQDPREFQLGQIRRRFSHRETRLDASSGTKEGTVLDFDMKPSDPDFPFEMDTLKCSLIVPSSYPGPNARSRPRLRVKNKDIPRGFAINVEKGFDKLVGERNDATLLSLMSALDRNLENFLSEKKAETVTLVANADRRHMAALAARPVDVPLESALVQGIVDFPHVSKPPEVFTAAEKAEAQRNRETETRQLEARLGRMALFKKSQDGLEYTLPIEPRMRSELPKSLQALRAAKLFVPQFYPLQVCRVELEGAESEEAKLIEAAFEERAREAKGVNLMSRINYLAQNMHLLFKTIPKPPAETKGQETQTLESSLLAQSSSISRDPDDDRSHIKIIPRPPEWTVFGSSDVSESDDDYSYDSGDEPEDGGVQLPHSEPQDVEVPKKNPEQGTAVLFPFIELYGVELLEVTILNIAVKCERCKDIRVFNGLKHNAPKSESCKKCTSTLAVTFRRDLIHANAVRAGFLDFIGCQVADMLPSTFTPTCSECSVPLPPPGVISVRGDTTTTACRSCHQKLTLKIPEVKFLRITPSATVASTRPQRKSETLGLVAGTELPDRGRCRHYAKSYRWFRFSCCNKVYPCDRCHDEKEEHANEHGNRMICGWCSREQPFRPEDCGLCHKGVVRRTGSGFWEGGKGTRDRVRMSRKDPRKHKRIGTAKAP